MRHRWVTLLAYLLYIIVFIDVCSIVLVGAAAGDTSSSNPLVNLDVHSERVIHEANFALEELKKLSDSTIYSTLSLAEITSAQEQEGIFHHNIILNVELASPYFRSRQEKEKYEMIVMRHKEDGVRSFAIDEFPDMDEGAIESFWIRKVEKKRKLRKEAFRRLEIESLLLGEEPGLDSLPMKEKIDSNSVNDLLSMLDTEMLMEKRLADSSQFQARLRNSELLNEEKSLSRMSLNELYQVTQDMETGTYSDFQKFRAKKLLDDSMQELQLHLATLKK
jgi:hypothetical protein